MLERGIYFKRESINDVAPCLVSVIFLFLFFSIFFSICVVLIFYLREWKPVLPIRTIYRDINVVYNFENL